MTTRPGSTARPPKSEKQMRLGVVGMGIGRPNARAVAKNPRGVVAAVCDLVPERMDEFAIDLATLGNPDPKRFTSYQEMCRDPELDAVFVGTPNQLHVPVALEAVRNGKHVMVTKPLADSEAAARELVAEAEKAGVVNMMSLSTRFGPAATYLSEQARRGTFGELYYARARSVRRNGIPAWNTGFIQKGGGAFRDMGVHALDAVWAILGHPRPVSVTGVAGAKFGPRGLGYWYSREQPPESVWRQYAADDYAGGFVRFETPKGGDVGVQIESFWASHQPGEFQIELFGTEAGARLAPLTLYKMENGVESDVTVNLPKRDDGSGWDAIAAHFISCILDGTECSAPLRHGLQVQIMMEALLRSAETGKEERIEEF